MELKETEQERKRKSLILKIALFATGLSGIVAEYILSTLASYFLGDSIFQFTVVVSLMLFSMGLGSQLTPLFKKELLEKFIIIEFLLSILVSFSAILVYIISGYSMYTGVYLYSLSIAIGLMIGLEIPLVTRLNQEYEALRLNIASVMSYDYFGSLLGGLFFAFFGLPYLGLTYTPFVLGGINFAVAITLFIQLQYLIQRKQKLFLYPTAVLVLIILILGGIFAQPIITFSEQRKYKDKIIYEEQSRYQKIVITKWKNDYWLYLNARQQLSTVDEEMYHEALVHPAMKLNGKPKDVLILGGGDGCAARESLKYPSVETITVVDLDPAITNLAKTHPVLLQTNDSSFYHPKVKIENQDAMVFLQNDKNFYDAIIIDLPDPRTVDLNKLYTSEMYKLCKRQLRPKGVLVTQAGSPYHSRTSYECIYKTMQHAGFATAKLHAHILTFGEWGWILGVKEEALSEEKLKINLRKLKFNDISTTWLNNEAMLGLTSFGKQNNDFFISPDQKIEVNTMQNQVLYRYYLRGRWDLY